MFNDFIKLVKETYHTNDFIPLHQPTFTGNEKKYLLETLDSTYVSSVGEYVNIFEKKIAEYTKAKYAIATVNGTAALHVALISAGVEQGTEVITQSLTFVATCNAIRYCGANPVFLDVDRETLSLSFEGVRNFLDEHCEVREDSFCWNKTTNNRIVACLPMHTFGFPAVLEELNEICNQYNIVLVEDAAESLGSFYKNKHTGTIGEVSALSFNGNKIITTGGGGMVLTNNKSIAKRVKHLTTTAKLPHRWHFEHDEIAFNYRMPNLNAALGVAQLEELPHFLERKRQLATMYQNWGDEHGMHFAREPSKTLANYWLNTAITENINQRDEMLEVTNNHGVMTRPAWTPMHLLNMYKDCQQYELKNTKWLCERIVNVPSSVVSHV